MSASDRHRLPNFLILGAAKSGTTFLWTEFQRHPEIFMSQTKEPSFFTDSFHVTTHAPAYARLFADAGDARWVGEASHAYMTFPESADAVRSFLNPERFVVILRDPIERAHSLYNHMSRRGREWATSFEAGLEREERRLNNPRHRRSSHNAFTNFGYVESGRYGAQLQRYFGLFGRDRFEVVFFEELLENPVAVMTSLYGFLDVEPILDVGEPKNRGGVKARSDRLSLALYHASRHTSPATSERIDRIIRRLTVPAPQTVGLATQRQLAERFNDDVDLLDTLVGRPAPWPWRPSGRTAI
jgi:hypothetical protein